MKVSALLLGLFFALASALPCLAGEMKSKTEESLTYLTHIKPPYDSGSRLHYEADLLRLMLEKTRATHGDFALSSTPDVNTTLRDIRMLKTNRKANFVRAFAVDKTLLEDPDLIYIDFPIMRGSSSYRICFTAKENLQRFAKIKYFDTLVSLSMVQGVGWPDKPILNNAGFRVFEAGSKRAIFEMAARGRADLFCRGIAEYKSEWDLYRHELPNLRIEENILIFYPFPRFFFAHRSDKKLLDRLQEGLTRARADGSFINLWKRYHAEAIALAKLDKRRAFVLDNPSLKGVDLDYELYFYPLKNIQPQP